MRARTHAPSIIGLGLAVIAVGAALSAPLAYTTKRVHGDREQATEDHRRALQRAMDWMSGAKCAAWSERQSRLEGRYEAKGVRPSGSS